MQRTGPIGLTHCNYIVMIIIILGNVCKLFATIELFLIAEYHAKCNYLTPESYTGPGEGKDLRGFTSR